ncbi:MAG: phosphatase PAP2 family protein, partial [Acetobacteraceae bacterium]
MKFITDFADLAVIIPLSLVAAAMLGLTGWWRGAIVWLLAICVPLAIMALLKLALFACGPVRIGELVQSPSGHTASAAIVYGGLTGLIALRQGAGLVPALLPAPIAAALIGLSRLALDVHTLPEVLIGGAIGCAGAAAML